MPASCPITPISHARWIFMLASARFLRRYDTAPCRVGFKLCLFYKANHSNTLPRQGGFQKNALFHYSFLLAPDTERYTMPISSGIPNFLVTLPLTGDSPPLRRGSSVPEFPEFPMTDFTELTLGTRFFKRELVLIRFAPKARLRNVSALRAEFGVNRISTRELFRAHIRTCGWRS